MQRFSRRASKAFPLRAIVIPSNARETYPHEALLGNRMLRSVQRDKRAATSNPRLPLEAATETCDTDQSRSWAAFTFFPNT
jgi:hypothetical protein